MSNIFKLFYSVVNNPEAMSKSTSQDYSHIYNINIRSTMM